MRFEDPLILKYLFMAALAAALFLFWAEWSCRKLSIRFAEKQLLAKLISSRVGARRVLKASLDIVAIILIGIALARPQWGLSWKQKTAEGLDVIFAVDVSKSMLASDTEPDRLSFAKREIRDFVERLKGDRVGLIGFSGDAFLFCPLTADYGAFFLTLDNLGINSVPRGGTSIAAAIKEAVKTFSWALAADKALILISDGEQTEGDAVEAAADAKKTGVQISCIGIGSREGSPIIYNDGKGSSITVKDESGRVVKSRLDEAALKTVADETGGAYVHAAEGDFGLDEIYKERLSKMKKRQAEESLSRSYQDRFQYPLALAFLALFISTAISMTGGHGKD